MGSKWRNKMRGLVPKFIMLICLLHINYRPFDPCERVLTELGNCGGNRRRKGLICSNSLDALSSDDESNYKHGIFSQAFNFEVFLFLSSQSVKAILDRGVDANSCSPEGFRPICIAAFWGYNGIVQLLMNRG